MLPSVHLVVCSGRDETHTLYTMHCTPSWATTGKWLQPVEERRWWGGAVVSSECSRAFYAQRAEQQCEEKLGKARSAFHVPLCCT